MYRTAELFTVVFYGLRIFGRKTAQLCVTQCEWLTTETPSISDAVQRGENTRKKSLLNYESPALTAELQAHIFCKTNHAVAVNQDRKDSDYSDRQALKGRSKWLWHRWRRCCAFLDQCIQLV